MNADSTATNSYDYVIVGGGIAGVYSGWRILQDAKEKGGKIPSVIVLEQNDRIGGRLLSLEPPGISDTRVEIGGMRYSDAHRWVCSLTEHLELDFQPLPADRPENIAYLRSKLMRYQDRTDPSKIPYNVAPDERTEKALSSLIMLSAQRAIREATGDPKAEPTPEQWEKARKTGAFHGAQLQNLSMRYVMLNTVSHEAFKMQEDIGGYDSVLHTWNAIDGYPWNLGDFAHPVKFHHTVEGYDQVPIKTAQLLVDLGGTICTNTTVTSLDHDSATRTFTIVAQSENEASPVSYEATRVIMAMPLRSLEILNRQNNFFWDPGSEQEEKFKCVTPIPLFKLALCYSRPWWQDLPPVEVPGHGPRKITKGKSNTDLPIRQCYYWSTDEQTGRSVILIYDDGVDLSYWAGLRNRSEDRYPYDPKQAGGAEEPPRWKEHQAPRLMAEEVHRQLLLMHGRNADDPVPVPYAASYMDWGEDPYGGGANFWHVGVDSVTAAKEIVQPLDMEMYICGECWSHAQGWVEGALQTCEDMLQHHLDIAEPDWYKPNAS
jgi:monoamine oxidase